MAHKRYLYIEPPCKIMYLTMSMSASVLTMSMSASVYNLQDWHRLFEPTMSKLSKTVHYVQPNPQSSHYRNEHQPMEKVVRWHELCLYDCSHKPERLAGNLRHSDAAGLGKGTRSRGSSTERIQTRKQNLTASNFHGLEKGAKNRGTITEWIQTRKQRLTLTASNFHRILNRKAKVTETFLDSELLAHTFLVPAMDHRTS